jgi:two-component system sensor histidine kinase AlgZ
VTPEGSIVRSTLRALLEPKRLVPTALMGGALVLVQWRTTREPLAAPLAIVMCVAFVLCAPLAWRVLFPEGLDLRHGAVRVLLYSAIGVGVVLIVGKVLPELLSMGPTIMTQHSSLVVCVALFLVGGFGLGRDIGFEASLASARKKAVELGVEAERAQLLALRSHLDPHFLFNTLNAIAELCRADGEAAEKAILQLSRILRAMLRGVRAPSWPLSRELELVKDVFALHLLRDPDMFELAWDVPSELPDVAVPPMILLPIAENAITHGPSAGHGGTVRVSALADGDTLTVAIENPGSYSGPRAGSEGVPTTIRRLHLAYGDDATLAISDRGGSTEVSVILPKRDVAAGVSA